MEEIEIPWIMWYHSINDNNWDKNSYKEIHEINNLYDYQYLKETFKQDHYQNGMFFCMKKDIFPNWEDPDNRLGGSLSFKVKSISVLQEWSDLLLNCITELILSENNDEINGISISPKKEFNIIKIWLRSPVKNLNNIEYQLKLYDPYLNKKNIKIKKYY